MAAPTLSTRVTPGGKPLEDGLSTKISCSLDTDLEIIERSVTPPGVEGGDFKDLTNMHTVTWRTMLPKRLKTLTPVSAVCFYDPVMYTRANTLVNRNTSWTCLFPDSSTLTFWGALKNCIPNEHVEGEIPTMNVEIVPTNWDDTNDVEAGPVLVEVAGT